MTAQQINLDNIANNLSNSSTSGFQRRRVQFSDLLYQNMVSPGSASTQQTTQAAGLQVGLGTRPGASEIIQTQGDFTTTNNQLDLAIQGQGFFQITMPNGQIAYTRSGSFHTDSQGNMVTANGNPLTPAITIPLDGDERHHRLRWHGFDHPARTDGRIQQIGQIQLAMFVNPGGLNSIGNNLYLATTASGDPITGNPGGAEGLGTLLQGQLEQSNVNVVDEFIQMILAQRSYESNSRVVKAADEMFQQVNQLNQ